MAGYASIAMFGNTQQPVDVMVQTGHLFAPMPDTIRDDMAFIDRIHFYLPGWEVPKMRNETSPITTGSLLTTLPSTARPAQVELHGGHRSHFSLGSHLNTRDRKAVRRTVSGLMKILYPHGQVKPKDLEETLTFALEGTATGEGAAQEDGILRVLHTSFSYLITETGEERFVGVPEQGGRDLISAEPLPPGTVYSASEWGRNRRAVPDRGEPVQRHRKAPNTPAASPAP